MRTAIIAMLTCFLFVTDCECRLHAKQKAKPKPVLVKVWTMENCGPCAQLERLLVKKGVTLTHACRPSRYMPVDAFPTCDYSDGVSDDGSRVRGNQCSYGQSVLVILWQEIGKEK